MKAKAFKQIAKFVNKNAPEILTGLMIVGVAISDYFLVKGTIKYVEESKMAEPEEKIDISDDKPIVATAKKAWRFTKKNWKYFVAPMAIKLTVLIFLCAKDKILFRRTAMATTAYQLSEAAFERYKQEVINKIGPEKEQEIRNEIAKDSANVQAEKLHVVYAHDKYLCQEESFEGGAPIIFWSSVDEIKDAINSINFDINRCGKDYVSYADYCYAIGAKPPKGSEDIGFDINNDGLLCLAAPEFGESDDGRPVLKVHLMTEPHRGYNIYGYRKD